MSVGLGSGIRVAVINLWFWKIDERKRKKDVQNYYPKFSVNLRFSIADISRLDFTDQLFNCTRTIDLKFLVRYICLTLCIETFLIRKP